MKLLDAQQALTVAREKARALGVDRLGTFLVEPPDDGGPLFSQYPTLALSTARWSRPDGSNGSLSAPGPESPWVIGRSACFQHFVNARPLVRPVTVVAFSLTGRPELGWDELSELVQWVFEAGSGIVFGHNTAGAGASIPGHAHYHYFQGRVPLTGHAVDTLESGPSTELGLTRDPLPAALYIASGDAAALTHVVWAAINSLEKQGVPYNLCACADGDGLARFWVFPRCGGDEGPGRIAFLELAGIYLLAESATDTTRPEALERLQASVSPRGSAVHRLLLDDACEALYSGRPSFTPRSAAAGRPSRRAWAGTRGTAWARRAQV